MEPLEFIKLLTEIDEERAEFEMRKDALIIHLGDTVIRFITALDETIITPTNGGVMVTASEIVVENEDGTHYPKLTDSLEIYLEGIDPRDL